MRPLSVPAWAREIACLVAVSVEEWENASWSLWYFSFLSGDERGKHLWEETAESRKDKVPFPLPLAHRALAVWIQIPILVCDKVFLLLATTQCFPACQKGLGSSEGAAGSEQARSISVLF